MAPRWLPAFRAVLLVALAASAALVFDFTHVLPVYDEVGSGCFRLSRSVYGFPFGRHAPLPLVGLVGFALLLGSTLAPSRIRGRLVPAGALLAGVAGVGLIGLQAILGLWCGLGTLMGVCGVSLALLALALPRVRPALSREAADPLRNWAWLSLALLALGAVQAWPRLRPADPLPPALQQLQAPGQITVVEITDFECGACRALAPILAGVLAEQGEEARLVRIHFPVPAHRFARGAARAALCAEEQGRGEALAGALFESEELSAVACREKALTLGVDRLRFDACVAGDEVEATLAEHEELLLSTGFPAVPTTYVGRRRFVGRVGADTLRRAFARERGAGVEPPGWAFTGIVALAALAVVLLGRRRRASS